MITLERVKTLSPLKVAIRDGDLNEDYSCSLVICENPVCICTSVGLVLAPASGPRAEDDEAREPLSFTLDLERRSINESKRKLEGRNKHYAKLFVKGLREDDWQLLQQEYIAYKTHLTETADPAAIRTNFPVEEIEDGVMVPYHEILPFGKRLLFTLNDAEFQFMDQYCIRTGCDCTDGSVSFVPLNKDWYIDKENLLENVLINYKTRRWDITEASGKTSFSGAEFRTAIEKEHPDLYKNMRDRHQHLKKLYRIFRDKHSASEPAVGSVLLPVGRNTPCPCGSGKKYKRCCGR